MDLKTFRRNFPPGEAVPDPLLRLLKFQNKSRGWYSGHFELAADPYPPKAWLDGDEASARQFIAFGQESDGSSYAFWLEEGRTLANAPIIFFGSEGTDCSVLADNLDGFFGLLALGVDQLGFAASWGEVKPAEEPAERLEEFRRWLWDEFRIKAAARPKAAIRAARKRRPDLQRWLDGWAGAHFRK